MLQLQERAANIGPALGQRLVSSTRWVEYCTSGTWYLNNATDTPVQHGWSRRQRENKQWATKAQLLGYKHDKSPNCRPQKPKQWATKHPCRVGPQNLLSSKRATKATSHESGDESELLFYFITHLATWSHSQIIQYQLAQRRFVTRPTSPDVGRITKRRWANVLVHRALYEPYRSWQYICATKKRRCM